MTLLIDLYSQILLWLKFALLIPTITKPIWWESGNGIISIRWLIRYLQRQKYVIRSRMESFFQIWFLFMLQTQRNWWTVCQTILHPSQTSIWESVHITISSLFNLYCLHVLIRISRTIRGVWKLIPLMKHAMNLFDSLEIKAIESNRYALQCKTALGNFDW